MQCNPFYRGSLFLLTYLLFPVNVLIGVLLGLWRMVITALFNIVHLGRMDISLLNRSVEAFDPGESDILYHGQMVVSKIVLLLIMLTHQFKPKFVEIQHISLQHSGSLP